MGGSDASKVDSLYRVIKLGERSFGNNDLWRLLETETYQPVLGGLEGVEPKRSGWGKVVEVEWLVGWCTKQNLMWEFMYGIRNFGETVCQETDVELNSLFFWG